MKKTLIMTLLAFLACGSLAAQHGHGGRHCGGCSHHGQQAQQPQVNADGIDMAVVKAFPSVKSVKKATKWTEVYDSNDKLLGYAVYSKPASNGIKGYNGETPVLIALTPKKVICGVILLPNREGMRYVKSIEEAGYFNQWNGLSIKKARKKQVDAVSGATFTSNAITKSVQAALQTL